MRTASPRCPSIRVSPTIVEMLILAGIKQYIEIHIGTRFSIGVPLWEKAFVVALYFVNRHVLITRGHGLKFERDFSHLKKSRKVLLLASCAALVVGTITFAVYSASAYHRFFHF